MTLASISSNIGPVSWPQAIVAVAFFACVAFVVYLLTRFE